MTASETQSGTRARETQIALGLLAHVDAGKTTLSEGLLYLSGAIRKRGRVDHGDSALDYDRQEQARGITIYAKEAYITHHGHGYTLLDTPGHVDFSAEMERTLSVLDYALVVISALDGVQAHTRTIWQLLDRYQIPTFIFVNKMDIAHDSKEELLAELQQELDPHCVQFYPHNDARDEEAALCDDDMLERFLAQGSLQEEQLTALIRERRLFPVFFGSALRLDGVEALLDALDAHTCMPEYPEVFGARIFKVSSDEQGNRLTHLKITGGSLRVKTRLYQEEKADQLRRYCGRGYEMLPEASAGMIVAVKGLRSLYPGEGLGAESEAIHPVLTPYMTYQLYPVSGGDLTQLTTACRQLAQEDPLLHVTLSADQKQLHLQLMGEIQCEVLLQQLKDRFGMEVRVDEGSVLYKETLAEPVEGVGHFEPLRHYAEVHVLLEPLPPGSGIEVASRCSQDVLAASWQRLILSHICEKEHVGVLGGFLISDLRITLLSGKAHLKHTEGGDFREAVYRAIRQGLRRGKSVLLEPYGSFRLEVNEESLSRVIYEIERIDGQFQLQASDPGMSVLSGSAPLAGLQKLARELPSHTRGRGRLYHTFDRYLPCRHAQDVLEARAYDCDRDVKEPCGSIFCAQGAGFYVPWDEVENYMHLPYAYVPEQEAPSPRPHADARSSSRSTPASDEELEAIFARTYGTKKKKVSDRESYARHEQQRASAQTRLLPECLLVDGYNIIHDWEELQTIAVSDLAAARHRLIDLMCSYQGYRRCTLILVFDAYQVKDQGTTMQQVDNIYVVYTKTAQTADSYIEQATHRLAEEYRVSVATSDGLEQLIAIGQGAMRISARGLREELIRLRAQGEEAASAYRSSGFSQPLAELRNWEKEDS